MVGFKGAHFPKDLIFYAVFFYVRYAVSFRDLEEISIKSDYATYSLSYSLFIFLRKTCWLISSLWLYPDNFALVLSGDFTILQYLRQFLVLALS